MIKIYTIDDGKGGSYKFMGVALINTFNFRTVEIDVVVLSKYKTDSNGESSSQL